MGYTSTEYTAPSDGYVIIGCGAVTEAFVTLYVNGQYISRALGVTGAQQAVESVYIRKGMKLKIAYDGLGAAHSAIFVPLQ